MSRYSFIMPAYKAKYFREALSSIQSQLYGDYNVIISDDCSPEHIDIIARPFLSDARVTYRKNAENMGAAKLTEHWNLLLEQCDSEFIIVASDDDIYDEHFLEKVDDIVRKYPDVNLIHTRARIIDGDGACGREDEPMIEYLPFDKHINHFINPKAILCIGNYVFRTSALKKAGGFATLPLGWKADSATAIELSKAGVVCPPDVLFSFRMSGQNISSQAHGNKITDKLKSEATLSFYSKYILPANLPSKVMDGFKKKLGGEIRSYYTSFSTKDFLAVFKSMRRLNMFVTSRNVLSFCTYWIHEKFFLKKHGQC